MKLEKFMFCMTLETIGLAIGFLGAIVSVFALLIVVLATYVIYMYGDVFLQEYPGNYL